MPTAFRAGAIGFALLALAAAAVEVSREGSKPVGSVRRGGARDPLAAELARCSSLTPSSARDETCERVWAENRQRFLAAPSALPQRGGNRANGTPEPGATP